MSKSQFGACSPVEETEINQVTTPAIAFWLELNDALKSLEQYLVLVSDE